MPFRYLMALLVLVFVGCLSPNINPQPPIPDVIPDVTPQPPKPPVIVPGKISVLIIEETEDRGKPELRPWLGVWNSTKIRQYLNTHCEKENGLPQWRWVDQHTDFAYAGSPAWAEAMALPRKSLPWIIISNGTQGTSGPLPPTEAEVLALLERWGGK